MQPCEQGASFLFTFSYEDSDHTLIDLSAWSIKMQVRKGYEGVLIVELSTDNGRITVDSNENVTLSLTPEETASLAPGTYIYDLKAINLDGYAERIMEGEFQVIPEVTS